MQKKTQKRLHGICTILWLVSLICAIVECVNGGTPSWSEVLIPMGVLALDSGCDWIIATMEEKWGTISDE